MTGADEMSAVSRNGVGKCKGLGAQGGDIEGGGGDALKAHHCRPLWAARAVTRADLNTEQTTFALRQQKRALLVNGAKLSVLAPPGRPL